MASSSYYGGGVGGKIRNAKSRKSAKATPYDRPASSTRTPSWLSKLVFDPATKLLTSGARRFFAAVFPPKRLTTTTPHPPAEEEQERRNTHQGTHEDPKINAGVQEPVADVGGTSTRSDTSGLSELEQLLKHKTFTRSEIDRLTGLLKSRAVNLPVKDDRLAVDLPVKDDRRAVDLPVKDDRLGFELNPSGVDSGRHQEFPTTSNMNRSESLIPHRAVLDPAVASGEQDMQQHFADQIASPAELAKAYMNRRPEKLSPSLSSFGGRIASEDSLPPSNSRCIVKSQLSSLPVRTSVSSRVQESGFTTPRSRGRSAIYNMARTPYSRFQPVTYQKTFQVTEPKNYGDYRPPLSASQSALENGDQAASKPMALKRRSTVFDDDIGSSGPIRRIRQKHNLLPHGKSITISGKRLGSDFTRTSKRPFMGNADSEGTSTSSASYSHVPRESSMIAAKILEHLDKMTPKEKSPVSKLAAAREGSDFKLTPHMLRGQALKSMEDLDASILVRNAHKEPKLVDLPVSRLPESQEFTTQKQLSVEELSPVKSVRPEDKSTPDRIVQGSDNVKKLTTSIPSFSSQPPEKNWSFKMSAHEDWIEMDDDSHEHVPESTVKKPEEPMRDGKSSLTEGKTLDKSPVSPERTHVPSRTELEEGNVMADEKNTDLAANRSSQEVLSQSTKVGRSPILHRFESPTTTNNLTSVVSGVEAASSLKNVLPGANNAVAGVTELNASGNKDSKTDNTGIGNIGKPLAVNPVVPNNIISANAPFSNLSSNDGPPTSSAHISFAPASANLANQSFTHSSGNMESLAGATTNTSALSDSVIVPANGTSSNFSESVSGNGFSKKLFSSPLTIGSSEATDVKAGKVNGLSNFSSSSSVSTFAGASTGSSIFGGTSSTSASGTSVRKESSLTGSGGDNVSLSTPVHIGSSSSAALSGLSGVTPLVSSSIFNSSVSATKFDGTTQSAISASVSNKVNGAAPTTFKFGAAASASAEGSTTTASPGVFQFGSSSATPTGSNLFSSSNAGSSASPLATSTSIPAAGVFSFGAGSSSSATSVSKTTTGVFSFGAGSSSSATSVGNTTTGVFSFGAGTPVSSSAANPVTSSSSTAPALFSFGASVPAPSSDSSKVSSSGANVGSFASSFQAPMSSFGSPFSMPSSTGFSFDGSSAAFGTSTPMVFGSTTGVSSNPTFASSPLTPAGTQSVFGNSASPFGTTPGNNNQMSAEDCMAEDPIQSSTPATPVFGQSLVSPQSHISPFPVPSFQFPSTAAPSPVPSFQFGGQQSQVGQQNLPQFNPSGSSDFNLGGSFSLGSGGGGDKSGRRIVKASKNRNRKGR